MAKKKYSKMKRYEPAVLTLTFQSTIPSGSGATATDDYYDLSQIASVVNRRFYRQGINWAVAGIKCLSQPTGTQTLDGSITISQLPQTWMVENAWKKAKYVWSKQQDEALAQGGNESMKARFNDFKIFMDRNHASAGTVANMIPINFEDKTLGGAAQQFLPGTWEPSQIVLPNVNPDASGTEIEPVERFLHMVGRNVAGTNSRGILEGYADGRSTPFSPDPTGPAIENADNWMARMFDVGSDMEEVLENASDRNDTLPYDKNAYPNGEDNAPGLQIHDFELVTGTTIGGTTRFRGGNFPCGLIKITHENYQSEAVTVTTQIKLVPGTHRGYLCESMEA